MKHKHFTEDSNDMTALTLCSKYVRNIILLSLSFVNLHTDLKVYHCLQTKIKSNRHEN